MSETKKKKTIAELEKQLEIAVNKNAEFFKENSELKAHNKELLSDNAEIKERYSNLEKSINEKIDKIGSLTKRIEVLENTSVTNQEVSQEKTDVRDLKDSVASQDLVLPSGTMYTFLDAKGKIYAITENGKIWDHSSGGLWSENTKLNRQTLFNDYQSIRFPNQEYVRENKRDEKSSSQNHGVVLSDYFASIDDAFDEYYKAVEHL